MSERRSLFSKYAYSKNGVGRLEAAWFLLVVLPLERVWLRMRGRTDWTAHHRWKP